MLRIFQCRNATAAQSYFTQGLARVDYYTEGQEIPGVWLGRGAERLGLAKGSEGGAVDRGPFVALTENLHPVTGERLTLRTKINRTIGYDMSFHAPKGVSLAYAVHRDERIMEAFRASVRVTMREIEADASTRVRKDGAMEDRRTGNLCWAEFVHLTARPTEAAQGPDPHLHAHCFVMNATLDEQEGVWKAGQFMSLVRDAPYYEAAFHARLARGLRQAGYDLQRTRTGWDLAGIDRALVEKFSSRTAEIEAEAAVRGIEDPAAKSQLGAKTRKSKIKEARLADLGRAWSGRMTDEERDQLASVVADSRDRAASGDPLAGDDVDSANARALDWSVRHSFARRSTVPQRRLVAEALKRGVGEVEVDALWRRVPELPLLSQAIRGQIISTTHGVLQEEKAMLRFAIEGRATCAPLGERVEQRQGTAWTIQDQRLGPDQRAAVEHVLASTDRVMAIRGAAGVGKTTMMSEAIAAIRAGGTPVVVVTPTAEAARGEGSLREKGFSSAETVAKLLADPRLQNLSVNGRGGVLWVDEAGMLGAPTMCRLFELAEKHNARVVLCGDERQHKPVERGDALRILQRVGGINSAELLTVRRQVGLYKEAVEALSVGNQDEGLQKLGELGAFHEIEDGNERRLAAAQDYVDTIASGRSSLIVCPTHAEGDRMAAMVRGLQRERGMLKGGDREITRLRDLGFTEAQRASPALYEEGMVVQYRQHAKGVVAGDRCRVLETVQRHDGTQTVRGVTPRGVEIDLPLDCPDRFNVYQRETMPVAVGERVRFTGRGKTTDERGVVLNGSQGVVAGFTERGHLVVQSLDGRGRPKTVSSEFGHIAPGAVMTSHAAQGKDADRVVLVQTAAASAAANDEQFYVSVSRGKQSIGIYTDDVASMIEAVARSSSTLSGTELVANTPLEPRPTDRFRAIGLAADIAQRTARARSIDGAQPRRVKSAERTKDHRARGGPEREQGRERER